ncbi:MAG: AtpZ/AtpI family protein [Schwartzia sp.]|nr:AtpZ/AtpI family protein [Schwartzia sp. (in: firmicutes)]
MEKHDDTKQQKRRPFAVAFRYIWAASYFMGIGIYLATTVVVCLWLGMKFDECFDTAPKGRLFGIVIAFPAAIYSIYHNVRRFFVKKE